MQFPKWSCKNAVPKTELQNGVAKIELPKWSCSNGDGKRGCNTKKIVAKIEFPLNNEKVAKRIVKYGVQKGVVKTELLKRSCNSKKKKSCKKGTARNGL